MSPDPLQPNEVDALLAPDPRTATADLLSLRDAVTRMGEAFQRLAAAAERLRNTRDGSADRPPLQTDVEVPRPPGPPPMADGPAPPDPVD
jgi:hypothetical protein